jgi:pimeloyl-ACP methyl ester carboxylesterase
VSPGSPQYFRFDGHRLHYREYGAGPRPFVLTHGLLLSEKMHRPLARALAERGHRVITLDLLGHGASDRPRDMTAYSMQIYAEQVLALMDHLEIDEAVVGGTSLGANTSLEVAVAAPQRVRGLVLEMPVLDNALLAAALTFTPIMVALTFGERAMKMLARGARLLPTGAIWPVDVLLDVIRQDPGPSAAILQGLFFGRIAPPRRVRKTIETPALVIGHPSDPVHPFSDSDALVRELRNARLLRADSIVEARITPKRITGAIADFLDDCWKPRAVPQAA